MIGFGLRMLMLWFCCALGRVFDFFRRPALRQLGYVIAVVTLLAAADRWLPVPASVLKFGTEAAKTADAQWLTAWNVLSIWAFVFLITSIAQMRRRLSVMRFEDFSGGKAGIEASGFGVLIAAQLSSLREVFRAPDVDAAQAGGRQLEFQAEAGGLDLEKAISSEASFELGPFKIPVGFIIGLLAPIARGPRISGQIHHDGRNRILTIQLAGRLGEKSWELAETASTAADGTQTWRSSDELAAEIACRIFAEVSAGRTVRWQALPPYVSGVRAYQEALTHARERTLKRRTARQFFVQATGEDPAFGAAYYKLGVVYTELEQLDAAASAFELALAENSERWSVHYALAVNHTARAGRAFVEGATENGIRHLSIAHDHAREALRFARGAGSAAQVLGVTANILVLRAMNAWAGRTEAAVRDFSDAFRAARAGMKKSWRALCAAELGLEVERAELHRARKRARAFAAQSLRDLGEMETAAAELAKRSFPASRFYGFVRRSQLRSATRNLRQAHELVPFNAEVCLKLGHAYVLEKRWRAAARMLRDATRLDPELTDAWALLTLALAQLGHYHLAYETTRRVFACSQQSSPVGIAAMDEATGVQRELFDAIGALARRRDELPPHQRFRLLPAFFGLSYRIAERQFLCLTPAFATMDQLVGDAGQRDARIAALQAVADRAKALPAYRAKVAELVAKTKSGAEPESTMNELARLCEEQRQAGHALEFGEAATRLAHLYLRQDRLAEGEAFLRDAIAYLDSALDNEVRHHGLRALHSEVLRRLGRPREALQEALTAVQKDPVNAYERDILGWAYFKLAEHAAAQRAWEEALVLRPNDPNLHVNLGVVHLRRLDEGDDAGRRAILESARQHLEKALELYEDDDPSRNDARFFLTRVNAQAARYSDAIRELLALIEIDDRKTVLRLYLADAYLGKEDWRSAETIFRELAVELDAEMAAHGPAHPLPSPQGWEEKVGTALPFARLGIASALQGLEIQLEEALQQVQLARDASAKLEQPEVRASWSAKCDFFEGKILLKRDRVDDAVTKLEAALVVDSTPATYLTLAEALARRVEISGTPRLHIATIRRAERYYDTAARLDWPRELANELPRVSKRLASLSAM